MELQELKIRRYFQEAKHYSGFPVGSGVKTLPASAGDMGSIPDPVRSHV